MFLVYLVVMSPTYVHFLTKCAIIRELYNSLILLLNDFGRENKALK